MTPAAVSTCESKVSYYSRQEAKRVRKIRMRDGAPKLYIYRCGVCQQYHLTKRRDP